MFSKTGIIEGPYVSRIFGGSGYGFSWEGEGLHNLATRIKGHSPTIKYCYGYRDSDGPLFDRERAIVPRYFIRMHRTHGYQNLALLKDQEWRNITPNSDREDILTLAQHSVDRGY